jgi:hypothetical protein
VNPGSEDAAGIEPVRMEILKEISVEMSGAFLEMDISGLMV